MSLKKEKSPGKRKSERLESVADRSYQYFETNHLLSDIGGHTVRGGAVTMLSHGLKFAVSIIATAILARLLTPHDYGLIGMVAVATNFVSMFKDMGLSYPTVQQREINFDQISTLFWINVSVSVALIAIMVAIAPALSWFYGEPRLTMITIIMAVGFLLGGVTVQHDALLRRQMRFFALSGIALTSIVMGYTVGIILAWRGATYWSLVFSQLGLLATNAIGVFLLCRWRPGLPKRNSGVMSMVTFGGNITGYAVINYLSKNFDSLMIGKFWGAQNLGLFNKAGQLLAMPSEQVDEPLSSVALPALSRLADSPERYRRAYLRMLDKVMLLTMPAIALAIVCSDWLVLILLGSQWTGSARVLVFLGIAGLFQPVVNSAGWLFLTQGRGRHMLQWSMMNAPISITAIMCGLPWGPMGVAASYSLTRLLLVNPLLYWFVGRTGPVRTGDFYRHMAPFVLAAISAVVACLAFRWLFRIETPLINIVCSAAITAGVTLSVLWLIPTGRAALLDVKYSLQLLRTIGTRSAVPAQES
jgi:PST family polysaccharide transporter